MPSAADVIRIWAELERKDDRLVISDLYQEAELLGRQLAHERKTHREVMAELRKLKEKTSGG